MLESPSNPAAIFHRKGGEWWGPKGGDPNPEEVGVRTVGAPKGGGPNISRFFFPSPVGNFALLSLSLGVFSWFFGGVWKRRAVKCARLDFSGCRVNPRRHNCNSLPDFP